MLHIIHHTPGLEREDRSPTDTTNNGSHFANEEESRERRATDEEHAANKSPNSANKGSNTNEQGYLAHKKQRPPRTLQ